jgi:CubicO group peptidase (beta-lactamase class C family)
MNYLTKSRKFICLLLLLVLCFTGWNVSRAQANFTDGAGSGEYAAFFDTFLQEQLANEHIAGATAAVVQNGEIAFAQGYGYSDVDASIPVRADQSLFFIGSAGKLFTWTAVMQLAEQGKLDLHADVNDYLDFEIPVTFVEPITLHHLMTHTAGFEEEYNSLFVDSPEKLLPLREHLVRSMPGRVYPPGKVSAYSNYGTALAGYIIERVSGESFEEYLANHLLQPLGMNQSFVGNSQSAEWTDDLSKGFRYRNEKYSPVEFEWTAAVPCAPVRTTMTDLSRFMLAHLNGGCVDGACILKDATIEQMHRPQFTHHPQMKGFAYGFLDSQINGQRVLWHLGESPTFTTILAIIPEQQLGLAVSYNTPLSDGRKVLFDFMDAFFPVERAELAAQPLPGWEERAQLFNGFYAPARSAHTTSQVLVRYWQSAAVMIDQGKLTFNGIDFIESEPGVFHQINGDRVVALEQDERGQRWLFFGPLAYFQVPWYETAGFLLIVLGSCLLIFLSAWIFWPVRMLRDPGKSNKPKQGVLWLAAGLGFYDIGLMVWFLFLQLKLAEQYVFEQAAANLINGLYWLAIPWTLVVVVLALRSWLCQEGTLSWRMHYALVAAAAVVFLWLVWSLNLLCGLA